YIGFTKDLRRRLKEHLNEKVYTTKRMRKPNLIYYEAYDKEELAKLREKKLKQFGSSYKRLIKRLNLGT
ncbi:MAG: GIY-YIG nuclease family protein, partial [Microgenomates group bacterium]